MNSRENENENRNIYLTRIAQLIVYYRINKPILFWIITIISSVCLIVFILTLFELNFIPSAFDKITTNKINYFIKLISFLYLVILVMFMFLASSPAKKEFIRFAFSIIISILIVFVFDSLYKCLKAIFDIQNINFTEFCTFVAAISTFLAFVVSSINYVKANKRAEKAEKYNAKLDREVRKRYSEESERTIFFQLLDLHTKKIENINYNNTLGAQAFREYSNIANTYFNLYIIYSHIICSRKKTFDEDYKVHKDVINSIFIQKNESLGDFIDSIVNADYKYLKNILQKELNSLNISIPNNYYDNNLYKYWSAQIIIKHKNDFPYLFNAVKYVADIMYKEYGHILGHYFRNMYYVMDTINNFSDRKNYKELFRAQLSRYELSLGFFNAVSSRSSLKMVKLLEEFDIFKDLYEEDLIMFKLAKEKGIEPSKLTKDILNEYKAEITKLSDN